MSAPFLGEIKMFAGNFAPRGYAMCDGQLLAISQNTALFSLLGTFYGGNGTSNFALPNLQNSVPVGAGNGVGLSPRVVGEAGGEAAVTLLSSEVPLHQHALRAFTGRGGTNFNTPANGSTLTSSQGGTLYTGATNTTMMNSGAVSIVGGSQPHNNYMPSLGLVFIVAMSGIFPARN